MLCLATESPVTGSCWRTCLQTPSRVLESETVRPEAAQLQNISDPPRGLIRRQASSLQYRSLPLPALPLRHPLHPGKKRLPFSIKHWPLTILFIRSWPRSLPLSSSAQLSSHPLVHSGVENLTGHESSAVETAQHGPALKTPW